VLLSIFSSSIPLSRPKCPVTVDETQGFTTEEHPADNYFKTLLDRERAKRPPYLSVRREFFTSHVAHFRHDQDGKLRTAVDCSSGTWAPFYDLYGQRYWYDLASDKMTMDVEEVRAPRIVCNSRRYAAHGACCALRHARAPYRRTPANVQCVGRGGCGKPRRCRMAHSPHRAAASHRPLGEIVRRCGGSRRRGCCKGAGAGTCGASGCCDCTRRARPSARGTGNTSTARR
jgi:hypothetical protein